jgi:hypothetical protein
VIKSSRPVYPIDHVEKTLNAIASAANDLSGKPAVPGISEGLILSLLLVQAQIATSIATDVRYLADAKFAEDKRGGYLGPTEMNPSRAKEGGVDA